MSERECVVFQQYSKELQELLVAERITYNVAHSLYQNEGLIDLEKEEHVKSCESEDVRAEYLVGLLQQLILTDSSQFERIVDVLKSHSELRPVLDKMEEEMWKDVRFILKLLRKKVPPRKNHSLGIELGIPHYTLKTIEEDYHGNSERIRTEIVAEWLKGNTNCEVSLHFLKGVANHWSYRLPCQYLSREGVLISLVVAVLAVLCGIMITLFSWNSTLSDYVHRRGSYPGPEFKHAIDHVSVPQLSGSNIYIKSLPHLNQTVLGRGEEVKDITDWIQAKYNVMVVGKPGFGKSTLALHAGQSLEDGGWEVFWVDVDEHFDKQAKFNDIKSFYGVIYEWSEERNKPTVLILDNFDSLLVTERKKQLFQVTFLKKMLSFQHTLQLMVTTQIETTNEKFHLVRVDNVSRDVSLEILEQNKGLDIEFTDEQKNTIAELVGDCPLALNLVIALIDSYKNISEPVEQAIRKLNESIGKEDMKYTLEKYNRLMDLAFDNLESSSQCCGCCTGRYPGSFSELLFPITAEMVDFPCNGSFFKGCVYGLDRNSLLDRYSLDGIIRYKMHTLVKSYFSARKQMVDCAKAYRLMYSLFFTEYCALPKLYASADLVKSSEILASDYHHLKRLLLYIMTYGSQNKYEAAVLMIAYQRGELTQKREYNQLYESVCQCEECVEYIVSLMGNEAFGQIVMNVSAEIHDLNFIRCELVTENFCSRAILYNPPGNGSTLKSLYNIEVLVTTCACTLMRNYHIAGAAVILGSIPAILLLKFIKLIHPDGILNINVKTVVFIYLNFIPSVVKLYFGSEIEKILLGFEEELQLLYAFLAQLFYEFFVIWFAGHFFQQNEVLYAASVKMNNLLMLIFLLVPVLSILCGDLMGIYTFNAVMWNTGAFTVLLIGRYFIFDYVTKKMSNGLLLRLFFRLNLGILSIVSEAACRLFLFDTSFKMNVVGIVASVPYMLATMVLTTSFISYCF